MFKNTEINRIATKRIATALGELNEEAIYVGGAVVSLYIDDPAAEDVRPTADIDISLRIASLTELENLRENLIKKGFIQSAEDDVVCRFRYNDIKVDVMSTQEVGWAPANPWFEKGFDAAKQMSLGDNVNIQILPLPYFLATKFSAFHDRGAADARTSHDFEDIVYLLDYTSDLVEQIYDSNKEVKDFLLVSFKKILNEDSLQEAILAHLFYEDQETRFNTIIEKLETLTNVL